MLPKLSGAAPDPDHADEYVRVAEKTGLRVQCRTEGLSAVPNLQFYEDSIGWNANFVIVGKIRTLCVARGPPRVPRYLSGFHAVSSREGLISPRLLVYQTGLDTNSIELRRGSPSAGQG